MNSKDEKQKKGRIKVFPKIRKSVKEKENQTNAKRERTMEDDWKLTERGGAEI